jgi:hypothetical protein
MHIAALTLTPDPCEQVFTQAPLYGSGHVPSYGSPRQVPSSDGYGGVPAVKTLGQHFRPRLCTDVLRIS